MGTHYFEDGVDKETQERYPVKEEEESVAPCNAPCGGGPCWGCE